MQVLALTTMEKLRHVPVEFWLKLAMIVVVFVLVVLLIRGISQMNKALLAAGIFFLVAVLGFHWIYDRNEPRFLTPVIDKIAPFFPSKSTTKHW
jgi:hypothetical protein